MSLSVQTVYVNQAQQIAALWNDFVDWYFKVNRINQLTSQNGAQDAWKAMGTAAQGADGGLGTADAAPVITNPITVGTPPLEMTAADIINALNDMIELTKVFDGTLTAASYAQVDHRGDAPSVSNLSS